VGAIAKKPLLGLPRHMLDPPSRSLKLSLKTRQGIFEHGLHQRRLWAPRVEAGLGGAELCWEHADTGPLLMPGGPVGRHGRHALCRYGLG
jgi:hypothetical protein